MPSAFSPQPLLATRSAASCSRRSSIARPSRRPRVEGGGRNVIILLLRLGGGRRRPDEVWPRRRTIQRSLSYADTIFGATDLRDHTSFPLHLLVSNVCRLAAFASNNLECRIFGPATLDRNGRVSDGSDVAVSVLSRKHSSTPASRAARRLRRCGGANRAQNRAAGAT